MTGDSHGNAGVNNAKSKLVEWQVVQIKREFEAGKRGKDNSGRFGITGNTYNAIGRDDHWPHIEIPEENKVDAVPFQAHAWVCSSGHRNVSGSIEVGKRKRCGECCEVVVIGSIKSEVG